MKHLGTKRIETERLILRRFALEDADKMYHNWASDPEVTRFLVWPTHSNVEVTRGILTEWTAAYENPDKYIWCIVKKENDEPVGSIGVVHCSERASSMEIGYCIAKSYWHQGITSEALSAVMKYLLEEVGANRIESRHDPRNPHSGAVMKKCGMKYEGTRIQADWNNSGVCDSVLYGYVKGMADMQNESASAHEKDLIQTAEKETGAQTQKKTTPRNVISDETIEYVGILAKLELDDAQKEQAKKDMGEMLDYIDKLNELDTSNVEPMSHVFPVSNVFREDVVTNGDGSVMTLSNAPEKKDGGFKVPKTIG